MMKRCLWVLAAVWFCFSGTACSSKGRKAGEGHGHDHGEDNISVTKYGKHTELFVEFPPLVTGLKAAFVSHLTIVGQNFRPVESGRLTVSFVRDGRVARRLVAEKLLRTGIFRPSGKPPEPGTYRLVFELVSSAVSDRIEVTGVRVNRSQAEAKKEGGKEGEPAGAISFLKEQQWSIPFANAPVGRRTLRQGFEVPGVTRSELGASTLLTAPVSGRVTALSKRLREGVKVVKDDELLRISPVVMAQADLPALQLAFTEGRQALNLAKSRLKRYETMAKANAISELELDRARYEVEKQRARMRSAAHRLWLFRRGRRQKTGRGHAIRMVAPLSGTVVRRFVSEGTSVNQGQPLVELADLNRLQITARVAEADVARLGRVIGASVRVPSGPTIELPRPDAIGARIDSRSRTLPVFFRLKNPGGLRLGQFVSVTLHVRKTTALAVPAGAVVDDDGRPVVFVQTGGESFVKRPVRLGVRDGGWVEVRSGLTEGVRVVVRGAYAILLSTKLRTGTSMGHGHAH